MDLVIRLSEDRERASFEVLCQSRRVYHELREGGKGWNSPTLGWSVKSWSFPEVGYDTVYLRGDRPERDQTICRFDIFQKSVVRDLLLELAEAHDWDIKIIEESRSLLEEYFFSEGG